MPAASSPARSRHAALAGIVLGGLVLTGGCGAEASPFSGAGDDGGADVSSVQDQVGVPEECRDAFPGQVERADLSEVTLWPPGFPEPPVPAVLCQTSGDLDGTTWRVGYAVDVAPHEALSAYRAALQPWRLRTVRRSSELAGEADDGTLFSVTAFEGGVTIIFSRGA